MINRRYTTIINNKTVIINRHYDSVRNDRGWRYDRYRPEFNDRDRAFYGRYWHDGGFVRWEHPYNYCLWNYNCGYPMLGGGYTFYGRYGYFWRPVTIFNSPGLVLWSLTYAAILQAQYDADVAYQQQLANPPAGYDPADYQDPGAPTQDEIDAEQNAPVINQTQTAMDDKMQNALANQSNEVAALLQNQQTPDLTTALQSYLFVVGDEVYSPTYAAGDSDDVYQCHVSGGDVLELAGDLPAENATSAQMVVAQSKQGSCAVGQVITVDLSTLQAELDSFTASTEDSMGTMNDQGVGQ